MKQEVMVLNGKEVKFGIEKEGLGFDYINKRNLPKMTPKDYRLYLTFKQITDNRQELVSRLSEVYTNFEEKVKNTTIYSNTISLNTIYFIYVGLNLDKTKIFLRLGSDVVTDFEWVSKQFSLPLRLSEVNKWLKLVSPHYIRDTRGSIYLVTDGEYTKIGATSYNINKRLNELQTGNARKLTVIGSYRVKNKLTTEAYLHEKYKKYRVLGEWFKLSSEQINEILSNPVDIENKNYLELSVDKFKKIVNDIIPYIKNNITSLDYEYADLYKRLEYNVWKIKQDYVKDDNLLRYYSILYPEWLT